MLSVDSLIQLQETGIRTIDNGCVNRIDRVVESDFSPTIWASAQKMSSVYIAIYCIENSLRQFIVDRLSEKYGTNWWDDKISSKIKNDVNNLKKKEDRNKYHSTRGSAPIYYTMLNNISSIIISNWDDFSDLLPSQAWIASRIEDLEMSRNIIMHTGILPQIEIERIESIARDFIRQLNLG
jgi:hypothetical protein